MKKTSKKYFVGSTHETTNCGIVEVLEFNNSNDIYVKLLNTGYTLKTCGVALKSGSLKDRLFRSVYDIGFVDNGTTWKDGKRTKEYQTWMNMFHRCYRGDRSTRLLSYVDCEVDEFFHSFGNFEKWVKDQKGFDQEGWHLDKDILVKGNRVYSPETCCFVPKEINLLFTKRSGRRGGYPIGVSRRNKGGGYQVQLSQFGKTYMGTYNTSEEAFNAYKQAKEAYIKEVAEKWKDKIDPRVYDALVSYQVEITD